MTPLRLAALDEEDLLVLSSHVQDAVTSAGALRYEARSRRFVVPINRYAWEADRGFLARRRERRNSVLHFDRVLKVRSLGMPRSKKDVLSLLSVGFRPTDPPAGTIELTFSAGTTLRLEVECIEAQLSDLGGAWQAGSRPTHPV